MDLSRFRRLFICLPLCITACRDAKVAAYRIPKENDAPTAVAPVSAPAAAAPAGAMAGLAVAKTEGGGLTWTAPAHWKSKVASAMRKGTYTVSGQGGAEADLSITAFPGNVGGDLANVNRWRGQLQLPPIAETELPRALVSLNANGLTLLVVDLAGGPADHPLRLLGAILPYEGATWFFKLTGPDRLVANEKTAYLDFLRTIKIAVSTTGAAEVPPLIAVSPVEMTAGNPVTKADGPELKWTAPVHWQSKPASAMRQATYLIVGEDGATAEFAVTAFPGSVGGELANVNRWRGQLQLPPISEAELAGAISRFTVNRLPVTLVELTGGPSERPQGLMGAIVPSNGDNWFFKLAGPAALVAREKSSFLALVQSLQVPRTP